MSAGGRALAVQPGPPERLVGVDVADARDQALVQQRPLDRRSRACSRATTPRLVVAGLERVAARCGRSGTRAAPGRPSSVGERQPAERPLVDEPQLGPAVGEVEPASAGASAPGASAASTSSWPLMPRWAISACRWPSGARSTQPEVLAAAPAASTCVAASAGRRGRPARARDGARPRAAAGTRAALDRAVRRRGRARPRRTTSTSGSSGIRAVAEARRRVGARVDRRRRARRVGRGGLSSARRARQPAARPPSCCARCPSPSTSPPTTAAAVKIFSWSGPSSVTRYSGTPSAAAAVSSCRLVFQSRPAPRVAELRISGSSRWCTNVAAAASPHDR